MALRSAAFRGNHRLERAAANSPPLRPGERGHGVALLQAALMTLKFRLPLSTKKSGPPDGVSGPKPRTAVRAFRPAQKLRADGEAGRPPAARWDALLPVAPVPKPPNPPKPAPPPPVKPGPKPVA